MGCGSANKRVMKRKSFKWILTVSMLCFVHMVVAQLEVESFRKAGMADHEVIQLALDALGAQGRGKLSFDGSRTYRVARSLELPRRSQAGHFVLEGNGALLRADSDTIHIFNRIPRNQREALNEMMSTRFVIQDFVFQDGAKAINLGATFASAILRCHFRNHHEAAVDIQFGLQTRIEHCLSTNCFKDNFVLRHGEDWGGNQNNSQSNHSVIESCRVFARKDGETSFKVLASGGVVLSNIISEGHGQVQYAVYADRLNSTTVRYFKIENFHLEHAPLKAGIYVRMSGNSEINGIYYQIARDEVPLILAGRQSGLMHVSNIPHFVKGSVMQQEQFGGGAVWVLTHCHRAFYQSSNWRVRNLEGELVNELPYYFSGQEGGHGIRRWHGR